MTCIYIYDNNPCIYHTHYIIHSSDTIILSYVCMCITRAIISSNLYSTTSIYSSAYKPPTCVTIVYKPPKANYIIYTSTHYIHIYSIHIRWWSALCPSHKLPLHSTSCARVGQLALYDILTHCSDPELSRQHAIGVLYIGMRSINRAFSPTPLDL